MKSAIARYLALRFGTDDTGPGANGWESHSIEGFLEAAVGWGEDASSPSSEGGSGFPEAPSFQAFARFLYMGKLYE